MKQTGIQAEAQGVKGVVSEGQVTADLVKGLAAVLEKPIKDFLEANPQFHIADACCALPAVGGWVLGFQGVGIYPATVKQIGYAFSHYHGIGLNQAKLRELQKEKQELEQTMSASTEGKPN